MARRDGFFRAVCALAAPVALQSMLQASFSAVDQIMIGQLGSACVAGVGLAGKFASIHGVMVSAVGAVAGVMLAQYLGQENRPALRRSFRVNLLLALGVALLFSLACIALPRQIMALYSRDADTIAEAAAYLRILAGSFLPAAGCTLLSALLRCMERPARALAAGAAAAALNTLLNYLLIFGHGVPAMGAWGAALATLIAQWANLMLLMLLCRGVSKPLRGASMEGQRFNWKQYAAMLAPVLACELMWSLGENVYAGVYGHVGRQACAAMTLTAPVQSLTIGALCGLSQAAGVLVGKALGRGDGDGAYRSSVRLLLYGLMGAAMLSGLILCAAPLYVRLFRVEAEVRAMTRQILTAYALIAPIKVLNMILGSGILRSGGRTELVMWIDLIGTWGFGVPLACLGGFVWQLPIAWLYLLLSMEECVRLVLSIRTMRRRRWMRRIEA